MIPLIVEAALNGATPQAVQPHAPRTTEEIVASARACLGAGAAIVHHHNAEGLGDARHDAAPYVAAWQAILETHPDALLYPTIGSGGPHTTIRQRYAHVEALADAGLLRMGLVDPGSVSLGPIGRDGLPAPVDLVYVNSFADARHMIDVCRARGAGASVSIFDPSFLRVALAYHARGALPPSKIQLYFGGDALPFGLPHTAAGLSAYLAMLDGTGLPWMVGVIGGDVLRTPLAEIAILRGGHLRVGLEDYAGPRQPRNEELVAEVVALARQHGRAVASSREAAEILGLPPRV